MRETERVRILERMRQKVRERESERNMMQRKMNIQRKGMRERIVIEKMAFVALNPLLLTIFRLLHSTRVSMDPRSRGLLILAAYSVNEAVELFKSLNSLRDRIESKSMKALEGEISETALKLENVLDSHLSLQFLSQSAETESFQLGGDGTQPLVYSLNVEGIEEMVIKMEKLLNPWLQQEDEDEGCGKESDILGLSNHSEVDHVIRTLFISWLPEAEEEEEEPDDGGDGDILGLSEGDVSRSWFISWFATKAASIFNGRKEDYIQDLEDLLPQEQEEEDDDYAVLFKTAGTLTDFTRMKPEDRLGKINDGLMLWWINKVGASIFGMEMDSTQLLINHLPEDAATAAVVSSGIESTVKMVGLTDLFCKIRDDLLKDYHDLERAKVGSIVGMAGIGKTALAKKIIQDPLIQSRFECCIFVRMGPEFKWEDTLLAILAQIPDTDKMLHEILMVRKCLIVLDDCWIRGPMIMRGIYPRGNSQSAILFTTRIDAASLSIRKFFGGNIYRVPFLNKEESWDLLRKKIFGENRRIPHLEKYGKKIAENCEGLPLLILAVGGLLSQAEKTPQYWSKVAANKKNSIFVDACEQVSDVAYPSYHYLDQHLKACFLYLGAFPQNDEVRVSRLISLWSADGFLGVPYTILQRHAYEFLTVIVSDNVAMGTQWNLNYFRKVKAFSLHSIFWYLCRREARNEQFLHVLNSYTDANAEGIRSQRRLSIHDNTILTIKDARDSMASISSVRSLLCTGPYHQYQVPVCWGLRLLRVLDALTIRFYEFPIEVVKLVQLRYLGLTCNGNLPPSISNLWGLQCLILHQHQIIKSTSISHSYLPVEIWYLQELEHLQIIGRNIPNPPPGVGLRSLLTLLDVGAHTCTEPVLASIPNLEKLRVQIELMPVSVEPLRFCDDISHLQRLKSLQFVVVNPELTVAPAPSFSLFSKFIRKLTLSGFGYPWEDMHKIAELSNLEDLKLKCYAFQGEKWEVEEGEFVSLKYLSIEDTDLVQWTGNSHGLNVLNIKHCYRLLELPTLPPYLRMIRVVDCNPSTVTCAKQMESGMCDVYVHSSWLSDGKLS